VHVLSTCYAHALQGKKLDLRSANPLGALNLLLGRSGIMRGSAAAYFLVWLGNACINSQFGNYVNHLFGWGPQESAPLLVPARGDHQTRTRALARASANLGPNRALVGEVVEPSAARRLSPPPPRTARAHVLPRTHLRPPASRAQVLVGVMIAIAPPALVPRLGLKRSIEYGAIVYALGLLCTAFAHSPLKIIASTLLTSVGCICIPALVAFIANQAAPAERGALLGALETLQALPPSPGVGEWASPKAPALTIFALTLAPPLTSTLGPNPSPNRCRSSASPSPTRATAAYSPSRSPKLRRCDCPAQSSSLRLRTCWARSPSSVGPLPCSPWRRPASFDWPECARAVHAAFALLDRMADDVPNSNSCVTCGLMAASLIRAWLDGGAVIRQTHGGVVDVRGRSGFI
jgi:hypothetical protein